MNELPSHNGLAALRTILVAGLICGALDGLSALALAGGRWVRLFQFIASGVLGPHAFKGGLGAATLGIALHFSIALCAAAVYYTTSRAVPLLVERAILCGVAYGAAVHLFMYFVTIPLSAIGKRPFSTRGFLTQLMVHMIVVGPSIALVVRHYSRSKS
jgi:hypothetical protein